MSFVAYTAFEQKVTNNEFDGLANITGVFRNSTPATEICSAGFLCVKDALLPNEGYSGVNNNNSWYMKAAANTDLNGTPIFACDTHDVNELTDPVTGAIYKIGTNTLGLAAPAGVRVTYRQIVFDGMHHYRLGFGNVNGAIGTKTFFTIAAGLLVPAAAAPTANGTPYFKLLGTGTFTQGAYSDSNFTYVDVEACVAVA